MSARWFVAPVHTKILKLKNNYLKNISDGNKILYKKQRSYCWFLLRKSKTKYYENLDEEKVSDNKLFWKVIKPSLPDKSYVKEQINGRKRGNFKEGFREQILKILTMEI